MRSFLLYTDRMSFYEPITKANDASVDEYLRRITDPKRRQDCEQLVELMSAAAKEPPIMWGKSIVGFGKVKQAYASGREVEWMKIGFASRKKAISLYLTCDLDEMRPLLRDLGPHERGVGCLYIKTLDDIHLPTFKKMLQVAVKMAGKTKKEAGY